MHGHYAIKATSKIDHLKNLNLGLIKFYLIIYYFLRIYFMLINIINLII